MSAAASVIEAAAFDALEAGVNLAPVFQHVPKDTSPPVVIIADLDLTPYVVKGADEDRTGTLTITAIFAGEARKPLLDIQAEVEASLDGHVDERDGWTVQFSFLSNDGILVAEQVSEESDGGEAYVGNSRFQVTALKD